MSLVKRTLISLFATLLIAFSLQAAPKLPDNLEWITNDTDEVFSSPDAEKGGTFNSFRTNSLQTLRLVGPGTTYSGVRNNKMYLVVMHPNTANLIPSLATHWAYGDDHKTMYFRLNPDARWSDGRKVVADDFSFTLEFWRKKEIVDPFMNKYANDEYGEVVIFDPYTISVSSAKPHPRNELPAYISLWPTPRHFYPKMSNFVKEYNWKIAPNTGPYQVSEIKKRKSITYSRKKDWWAKDLKYFKNRFNVDKVKFSVIRDDNLAWEHFKKGNLDSFHFDSRHWHDKSKGKEFANGYIKKLWFYRNSSKISYGLWLNQDNSILRDRLVRLGIAHSMNIDKVNEQVLRNDMSRRKSFAEGFIGYSDQSIKPRAFDLDKANQYFDLAGWQERGNDGIRLKDGQRLSLSVTYGKESQTRELVVLREEFKRAGLELVLRQMDYSASYKSTIENKHDIFLGGSISEETPEYLLVFHSQYAHNSKGHNYSNTDNPEMDQLIDSYNLTTIAEEKMKYSRLIDHLIHEQSAWIPTLKTDSNRAGYWRWLKIPEIPGTKIGHRSLVVSPFDSPLVVSNGGLFWIDEEVKKETLNAKKEGKTFPPETRIDTTYQVRD